jgi:pteridine reductase
MSQKPDKKNSAKTCLITGASKRIGACTAKKFHDAGFNVIVHYNNSAQKANALVSTFNSIRNNSALALQADLTNKKQVQALAEAVLDGFGRLDVLVNNASSFYPTAFGECTHAQWDELIDSNLRAAFFLTQQLAPELSKQGGAVVNIVDTHADKPLQGFPIYSIAKAGLKAMTKSMAKELAPQVRVNGISPGAILWPPSLEDTSNPAVVTEREKILSEIPLRRLGEPQNIADAVFFLANSANYITGQTMRVDGGRYLV